MLKVIKAELDRLDESELPDASVGVMEWTSTQYNIVDRLSRYHQYLWYNANPSKTADKLLDRLSKYLNQDCGYIFTRGSKSE